MTTDEYVPSHAEARAYYVNARAPQVDTSASPAVEFDRFLARVRRDAAKEALDGYADALNDNRHAAVWGWHDFVRDVREWASGNYPEETP